MRAIDPFELLAGVPLVESFRSTPAGYLEHRSPFGRCLHEAPDRSAWLDVIAHLPYGRRPRRRRPSAGL